MNDLSRNQPEVSNIKSHAGFWLRFVSNHVSYAFARKLLSTDVTVAEWVVMREMYDAESMVPSRLAETTGLTRGAVSKLVDRLFHKKLLTRIERDDDRRYQTIALTEMGRKLVPELSALADENDAEFFSALTQRERQALIEILRKLAEANRLTKLPTE
jgi:DNA-binding MarR family transcriptional regulator